MKRRPHTWSEAGMSWSPTHCPPRFRGHRFAPLSHLSPQPGIVSYDKKPGARASPQMLEQCLGRGFPTHLSRTLAGLDQKLSHNHAESGGRSLCLAQRLDETSHTSGEICRLQATSTWPVFIGMSSPPEQGCKHSPTALERVMARDVHLGVTSKFR